MKVWILNHYATDMYFDGTGRHQSFAKYMIKKGYDVKIFCASTVHNSDMVIDTGQSSFLEKLGEDKVPYVFVKTRQYSGNGKTRILNMIDYYRGVLKVLSRFTKTEGAPDVILASSVHPLTLVAGLKYAKRNHIQCICEVRDLWPESIVEFTQLTKKNLVVKFLYRMEKWIYTKADALIFTMEGGAQYIIDQKWDDQIDLNKIYHINNGVDLEVFNQNKQNYRLEDDMIKSSKGFNVVYAGSLRAANNVRKLAYVAIELQERNINNINIFIYGDGPDKTEIEKIIDQNGLKNIHVMGKIEKKYIPSVLSIPQNINCLNYKYSDIFKYGGSQNKLFEYLASGKPIIANVKMGYDIIEKYQAGVVVGSDEMDDLMNVIVKLSRMTSEEYKILCDNAQTAAKDYDYKVLTAKLIQVIENVRRDKR